MRRWVAVLKELGTHCGGLAIAGASARTNTDDSEWQNLHMSPFEGMSDIGDGQSAIKARPPLCSEPFRHSKITPPIRHSWYRIVFYRVFSTNGVLWLHCYSRLVAHLLLEDGFGRRVPIALGCSSVTRHPCPKGSYR